MTSDEIREAFLEFFEQRDHLRRPSASLVPAEFDPSVLLTTAGMHPLMPYFLGQEKPPHHRLTTCQKVFRTTDIENIGNTTRHLTFFEMLGNFSFGDYFKHGAIEFAWDFSLNVLGFEPEDIWATVFEGDDELGLGPDEEAIEGWLSVGVPRERIVLASRADNFWQAGPIGPCGPCSELYFDRGLDWGTEDDLPAGENERFLEYWNLVFMQYKQDPVNVLTPLPAQNIDTGLGLNRMALIKQGVDSVFDTDQFAPLMDLGRELASSDPSDRSLRILADHSRAMTFLVGDGVVPSNESRGYILRRVMRRAILHGRRLGMEPGFLERYRSLVAELMGRGYPELVERSGEIAMWLRNEEQSFGHTLEQGTRLLNEIVAEALERGDEGISSEDAFRLHDTFGFPIDLTMELVAERGLGVDEAGFEALMDQQRSRSAEARTGPGATDALRSRAVELARGSGVPTQFVGYETLEQHTTVGAVDTVDGRVLVKLEESPFYATGGGQIADSGVVQCESGDCRARVADVLRLGDDQAVVLEVERGSLSAGERVVARVSPAVRHATECNHTATHLLHAALRERLGTHVRQAGSYVGPDKLRFDFTHGEALSAEDVAWVEDRVVSQIVANLRVRALTMPLEEARALGAMALFGEKYGDIVRVVQIGDGSFSRELCGGTHVRSTAEIGVFRITGESSSAANVRRIEALTGPEGVALLRRHDALAREAAALLRKTPADLPSAVADLQARLRESKARPTEPDFAVGDIAGKAIAVGDAKVLAEPLPPTDPKSLPDIADRLKGQLGDSAIVLGTANEGRVALVVAVSPALVARGVKAGHIVKTAAQVVGGGGGGRDTMAQAGGRDPSKLPEALDAAREAIAAALSGE
ncbi:MAG TPA: alanine--tRNA ligase [Solirubrobacteraceae bacterium]|jgi:alanyl-tRNA synthetase